MEMAKTQCREFKCFKDNYSLTISTQDVGLTQGSLMTKGHSLYRALKHSMRQQKGS